MPKLSNIYDILHSKSISLNLLAGLPPSRPQLTVSDEYKDLSL